MRHSTSVKSVAVGTVLALTVLVSGQGEPEIEVDTTGMRAAPEKRLAPAGLISCFDGSNSNRPAFRLRPRRGINLSGPDWTIRLSDWPEPGQFAKRSLIQPIMSDLHIELLLKEIPNPKEVASNACSALNLATWMFPPTTAYSGYVGKGCTLITKAAVPNTREFVPRRGDTVWRYDELCLSDPDDEDGRYVLRTVYFVLDYRGHLDLKSLERTLLHPDEEVRAAALGGDKDTIVNVYFLRERRVHVRLVRG